MLLVYSSCIFDIVMINNDFMYMFTKRLAQSSSELSGRGSVGVVLRLYLPMNAPYILGHVVDRGCDIPVESFVVYSPNIGLADSSYGEKIVLFLIFLSNIPYA
jgi:hypothetical protein